MGDDLLNAIEVKFKPGNKDLKFGTKIQIP